MSVFVLYLFSNLVMGAITHAPKAILIFCDIVGISLEYHNGHEALDGKSCVKVIEAQAKKYTDIKFVVMHAQWRKNLKLAQNEEIGYFNNIIHRTSCIIDVKIRTSAEFTRIIDEETGRKESNLNVHHSRQTVCFNVGILIRKAK